MYISQRKEHNENWINLNRMNMINHKSFKYMRKVGIKDSTKITLLQKIFKTIQTFS